MSSLPEPSLLTFYFFAAISIWLGLLSLRRGVRFIRYLQTELAKEYPEFTPFVTVFMPLRGIDDGLREMGRREEWKLVHSTTWWIAVVLVWIALIFTVVSGVGYVRKAASYLRESGL